VLQPDGVSVPSGFSIDRVTCAGVKERQRVRGKAAHHRAVSVLPCNFCVARLRNLHVNLDRGGSKRRRQQEASEGERYTKHDEIEDAAVAFSFFGGVQRDAR
jgi:hypothetical protein